MDSAKKSHPLLEELLACPLCGGAIAVAPDHARCLSCARTYPVRGRAIDFLDGAEIVPETHESNPPGPEFEAILERGDLLVLNIGAGSTRTKYANCVEFENKIFRHTDVAGDAHHLPFRAAVFDCVFAFNVFEHLRSPDAAAAEIFRVLKPAGTVAIHTAFLQALHEAPAHFYNATEFGVREWFAQFEIERCVVSANFSPGYMLAFLLSNVLSASREGKMAAAEYAALERTTLRDWASFWENRTAPPLGFHALENLPQSSQARISAGFELRARKPAAK